MIPLADRTAVDRQDAPGEVRAVDHLLHHVPRHAPLAVAELGDAVREAVLAPLDLAPQVLVVLRLALVPFSPSFAGLSLLLYLHPRERP
jgi:hypothetical protein